MLDILLVAVGGCLGAQARYGLSNWSVKRWGTAFPYGTLIINLSGSFVLGLFGALAARAHPERPGLSLAGGGRVLWRLHDLLDLLLRNPVPAARRPVASRPAGELARQLRSGAGRRRRWPLARLSQPVKIPSIYCNRKS